MKWQPWEYLLDLLDILGHFKEILIGKARQLGITWTVSGGYALHQAQFSRGAKVLSLSQGEEEAWDMVSKARFIWLHQPDFLRLPINHDSKSGFDFVDSDSEIRALPSTDKAGRGVDATLVIRDEVARHPYAKENFGAISPAIDAGGQQVDLSTFYKLDDTNHFTERVSRALQGAQKKELPSGLVLYHGGESGAALVFAGWKLRPVRQEGLSLEEWFDLRIKPKYSALEIEQEYPDTLETALKPPETVAYFDIKALNDMLSYVLPPFLDVSEIDTYNGIIKIWKKPEVGQDYIVFTDPSDGFDPFATVVMHSRTSEWVAIAHGKMPAEDCAKIHDSLVRYYNNADNDGETNASAGGKFYLTLEKLNTPRRSPRRDENGKIVRSKGEIVYGWYTAPHMRDTILSDYKEAIRKHLVILHDRDAIEEHRSFIRIDGKPQARGGCHDDFVMAGACAWSLYQHIPRGDFRAETIIIRRE